MASKKKPSAPLTFDLSMGLLRKIEEYQRQAGIASKSEVIRGAIESYDYDNYAPQEEPHRQISVRLPAKQKRELSRIAKRHKVSLGELLRVALRALPDQPPEKAEKAAKEAKERTKAAAGEKKGTDRKTGTRAAAKRAATERTTAKKAPARKNVARKASSPGTTSRKSKK